MIGLSTKTDIQMRAVYSSFIPTNSFGKRQQVLKIRYKKYKDKDELYFSGTQVLGHFCVSGAFSNSNRSNTSLTLQTMLDACIQNFFSEFQLCIGWREGELQENSEKVALF